MTGSFGQYSVNLNFSQVCCVHMHVFCSDLLLALSEKGVWLVELLLFERTDSMLEHTWLSFRTLSTLSPWILSFSSMALHTVCISRLKLYNHLCLIPQMSYLYKKTSFGCLTCTAYIQHPKPALGSCRCPACLPWPSISSVAMPAVWAVGSLLYPWVHWQVLWLCF